MKKIFLVAAILCFAFVAVVSAEQFSADMVTEMMGMTTTGKVYFKSYRTQRTEVDMMGIKTVQIVNHPKLYQLFPDTKKYVVSDIEEIKQQNPLLDVDNFMDWVEGNNLQKVGSETIEGYKCVIYEGDVAFIEGQPAMPMKLWYAAKLDYAIKSEITMSAPMSGTVTGVAKNIEVGKQPDDLFEIYPDIPKQKTPRRPWGLADFQCPPESQRGMREICLQRRTWTT